MALPAILLQGLKTFAVDKVMGMFSRGNGKKSKSGDKKSFFDKAKEMFGGVAGVAAPIAILVSLFKMLTDLACGKSSDSEWAKIVAPLKESLDGVFAPFGGTPDIINDGLHIVSDRDKVAQMTTEDHKQLAEGIVSATPKEALNSLENATQLQVAALEDSAKKTQPKSTESETNNKFGLTPETSSNTTTLAQVDELTAVNAAGIGLPGMNAQELKTKARAM